MSQLKGLVYLGIAGVALVYSKGMKADTLKKYELTDAHQPVYQSCMSTMKSTKSEFKDGASDYKGCACMAKYAVSEFEGAQLPAYNDMFSSLVGTAKKTRDTRDSSKKSAYENDMVTDFITLSTKHGLEMGEMMTMTSELGDHLSTCGQSASHRDAALAKIVALPVKGAPAKLVPIAKEPAASVVSLRGTSDPKKSASKR